MFDLISPINDKVVMDRLEKYFFLRGGGGGGLKDLKIIFNEFS